MAEVWDKRATFENGAAQPLANVNPTGFDIVSPAWDKNAQIEVDVDVDPTLSAEFDALTSTWRKNTQFLGTGAPWGFDNVVDPFTLLSEITSNVHDGDYALQVDNSNANDGLARFDLGSQTETIAAFWANFDNVGDILVGEELVFYRNADAAFAENNLLQLIENGGIQEIELITTLDGGDVSVGSFTRLSGWNHYVIYWIASSGPGNDDGEIFLLLNGTVELSSTGLDNDTIALQRIAFGKITSTVVAPTGSFIFDSVYADDASGAVFPLTLALHDEDYGMAVPNFNTIAKTARLTLDAVNQLEASTAFWLNTNSVDIGGANEISVCEGQNGGAQRQFRVRISENGANYTLKWTYRNDAGDSTTGMVNTNISDGWHHIYVYWKASSAPGADDGIIIFIVDGVIESSKLDIDNDAKDIDYCKYGIVVSSATTPSGLLYFDSIYLDSVSGAPFPLTLARREGSYGQTSPIFNQNHLYGQITPVEEATSFTTQFYVNADNLTLANGDEFIICRAENATDTIFELELQQNLGLLQLVLRAYDDDGVTTTESNAFTIDAYDIIRIVWIASSGSDDGTAHLYINGDLKSTIVMLDTDTLSITKIKYGAIEGLDAGTYGLLYMDEIKIADQAFIISTDCVSNATRQGSDPLDFDLIISPDGETYRFNDRVDKFVWGQTGFGMPPIDYITQRGPFQDGVSAFGFRVDPRVITIVHRRNSQSRQGYWDVRDDLINMLRPNRQPTDDFQLFVFRKVLPDGTKRDLNAIYNEGLAFRPSQLGRWDEWSTEEVLRFVAFDPIFFDPVSNSSIFITDIASELVFSITFDDDGIVFSTDDFSAQATILYTGTYKSFPTITIEGPITDPLIVNEATEEFLSLDYTVVAGEIVTITTEFGNKTIVNDIGTNLIGFLSSDSDLTSFHIAPDPEVEDGENIISVSGSATNNDTTITIAYLTRYIGM